MPTFLLFHGHRSVVQQCCVRLHSTSNNVAPAHAHYMPRIHINTCEQEINMGIVSQSPLYSHLKTQHVVTCCKRLHTSANIAQQETTMLAQQCGVLLRAFAWSLRFAVQGLKFLFSLIFTPFFLVFPILGLGVSENLLFPPCFQSIASAK